MTTKTTLYNLMQMNGGSCPTGGFSQSWGLETYVTDGIVHDSETFVEFLDTYLIACIGRCEGPLIREACKCTIRELAELEQLSNASKVTKESKEASLRMGKAFIRIMKAILKDSKDLEALTDRLGTKEISYPIAYGVVCRIIEAGVEDAIAAYVYSAANTLVQSAVKLIPLGNIEAQKILYGESDIMDRAIKLSMETELNDITNFCPGIDIASIRHETLAIRLYMS